MTNDLSQVTRMADEIIGGRVTCNGVRYDATAEELLAFEQAVLAKKTEIKKEVRRKLVAAFDSGELNKVEV